MADYGTAWEEAKMSSLSMDTCIRNEFLHINPDAVTWAEVRRVGNDAEGRLMAKAGHSENNMCVNMVTADCEDRNNSQKRNGDPDIRCYRCNGKGHRL